MNQPQLKWAIGLTRVAVAFPRQRRYSFAFRCQIACRYKLSEGMDVPAELDSFKFARQKSKLAGTIRGSHFVIKGEY